MNGDSYRPWWGSAENAARSPKFTSSEGNQVREGVLGKVQFVGAFVKVGGSGSEAVRGFIDHLSGRGGSTCRD